MELHDRLIIGREVTCEYFAWTESKGDLRCMWRSRHCTPRGGITNGLLRLARLAQHPRGHAAMVLHNRSLERIDQCGLQLVCQCENHFFTDEKPLRVADLKNPISDRLELHADARSQAAEEQSSRTQHAP